MRKFDFSLFQAVDSSILMIISIIMKLLNLNLCTTIKMYIETFFLRTVDAMNGLHSLTAKYIFLLTSFAAEFLLLQRCVNLYLLNVHPAGELNFRHKTLPSRVKSAMSG